MVTNQKHSSDSIANEQEVIRHTKKLAQIFRLNEQNAEVYSALSSENRALKKRLDDYYSQHKELKKEVNHLGKYIESPVHPSLRRRLKNCRLNRKLCRRTNWYRARQRTNRFIRFRLC